jgi:hypothetical protein
MAILDSCQNAVVLGGGTRLNVADRIGRAGPDAAVQVAAQIPELVS